MNVLIAIDMFKLYGISQTYELEMSILGACVLTAYLFFGQFYGILKIYVLIYIHVYIFVIDCGTNFVN